MLRFFLPKQENFFKYFQAIALDLVQAAEQFQWMLKDLNNREKYAKEIARHEEKADKTVNATLSKLHKTFITPFDRYDIHRFVENLDDILDSINRTAKRIVIYQVHSVPAEIEAIALIGVQATHIVCEAVKNLSNLKNASKILKACDSIDDFESESEQLLITGMSRLFEEETDFRELLKTKEIYEYANATIKSCRGVAHVMKDVVLEYS
jgi:hypothetical protein